MSKKLIKNIEHSQVIDLMNLISYEEGKVVSLTLAQEKGAGITLFAFDENEGVSTHAAAGDAMAFILEGQAKITIDGEALEASTGQVVIMPAHVPHAVKAITPFKMLLTVVKD